jgi:hypothetical protein
MSRVSGLLICLSLLSGLALSHAGEPHKHIVLQMRHGDGTIADVIVVTTDAADESLSPLELLHKHAGDKFDRYFGGQVYRFDSRYGNWDQVMSRGMIESKDLKVSELKDGDVLILHHPQP